MPDKVEGVFKSLASFASLRTALAYLCSVSILLEYHDDQRRSMISEEINTMVAQIPDEEGVLEECYHHATISLHTALLYASLLHYRKVGMLNPKLKHVELDRVLETADHCGLLEAMRQVRNSVFQVRPNKSMEALISEVTKLAIENGVELGRLEHLLYDFTSDVFSGTEIFQESEEVLMKSFDDAVAYYKEHLA